MAERGKLARDGCAARQPLFVDFVADAPENDRGVVAVAADQIGEINPVPGRIIATVIIGDFSGGPAVERFVDDDEPCLIGKIEEFRVRRIVAGPQRVAADGLQKPEAAAQLGQGEGRSERPEIVVQTDAVHAERFPVQEHPCIGIETDKAEAAAQRDPVDGRRRFPAIRFPPYRVPAHPATRAELRRVRFPRPPESIRMRRRNCRPEPRPRQRAAPAWSRYGKPRAGAVRAVFQGPRPMRQAGPRYS